MFKKFLLISLAVITLSCNSAKVNESKSVIDYTINLNDRSNDTFKVTLNVDSLSDENAIFQFAATAPGTYKVMDIGRFVSNFEAFDNKNKSVPVKKISVNQYELSNLEKIRRITYEIAETFDTPVKENSIYLMCGTSIEDDHVLINGQAVFGYFSGKQGESIRIQLNYPDHWKIGTALKKDEEGRYLANSYDHIVDSPFLLGELSEASSTIGDTDIDVFTFSQNKVVNSDEILSSMEEMLNAADKFVYGLPVDNYTFLYYFDDKSAGAWEHSYSSEYIFKEDKWENIEQSVKNTAAHEFFHIITPLNIHSEIIQQFNFVEPIPSRHLWLYEATTEWAANTMLFRSGQMSLNEYFELLQTKADVNQFFDESYSLEKLALTSYTKAGQEQYANIYFRGALTMGLLDIQLLALSDGKKGLRELIHELAMKYGSVKPFDEASFYDEIVRMTYPEVADFFEKYIIGATPLPYKEMYGKIGVLYEEEVLDSTKSEVGLSYYMSESGFTVIKCSESAAKLGFKKGDIIKSVNEEEFNEETITGIKKMWQGLKPGESYLATVTRDGKDTDIQAVMFPKINKNVFTLDPNASSSEKNLFAIWSEKLD